MVRSKNVGKKKTANICEQTFFLKSHKHRYQKMGEKRTKQFFQKHTNGSSKNVVEKNRPQKVQKTFFYIHTNIVTKKVFYIHPKIVTKNGGKKCAK